MSYNLKITVYNNVDYEQSFILKDSDGTVINMTGGKLLFGVTGGTSVMVHDSSAVGNKCAFITSATTGEFKLVLPFSILKAYKPGNYEHELIFINSDGKRLGVWNGMMIVKQGYA